MAPPDQSEALVECDRAGRIHGDPIGQGSKAVWQPPFKAGRHDDEVGAGALTAAVEAVGERERVLPPVEASVLRLAPGQQPEALAVEGGCRRS